MSEIQIGDRRGPRGPEGDRGERGHRGHDGHDGHDGDTGATGATGATGPASTPPAIAAANVNANGTFASQTGFTIISHPSAGHYRLTPANPIIPDVNTVTLGTLFGVLGGQISVVNNIGANIIDVFTFNAAGVATDDAFSIVLYEIA